MQKPKEIKLAVNLIWGSLLIGLVKILIYFIYLSELQGDIQTYLTVFLTFAFIVFIGFKISEGRNWARNTFLVFFAIGTLPGLLVVWQEFTRLPFVGVLSVGQFALQLGSIWILFTTPGKSYFKKLAE